MNKSCEKKITNAIIQSRKMAYLAVQMFKLSVHWWIMRVRRRARKHCRRPRSVASRVKSLCQISFRTRVHQSNKNSKSLKFKDRVRRLVKQKYRRLMRAKCHHSMASRVLPRFSSATPQTTMEMIMMLTILKRMILFKWQNPSNLVRRLLDQNSRQFQIIFKIRRQMTRQYRDRVPQVIQTHSCGRFQSETSRVMWTNPSLSHLHSFRKWISRKSVL